MLHFLFKSDILIYGGMFMSKEEEQVCCICGKNLRVMVITQSLLKVKGVVVMSVM